MTGDPVCPSCHGEGSHRMLACPGARWMTVTCSVCGGSGQAAEPSVRLYKLGKRCRDVRIGRQISQADAARAIGSSPQIVSKMENGMLEPSAEYLAWCGVEKEDTSMTNVAQGTDR